ncbi:hypothetical protein GOBAR_DD13890 [Gossypium barbadense]|nr:hypothetical protein GOBAR_DD13890 [Gossypium barbadense]
MSSRCVTIEADVNALSEKFRSLNLNSGVLRFEQNYFKRDGSLFWSERTKGENYKPNRMNPQQPVLDVAPLNCVPYMGPTNADDMFSSPTKENTEAVEAIGPAMIFLPSQSTREELDNIMAATKNGVALTGAAATGSVGPVIGKVDIGELVEISEFMSAGDFNCDIEPDGKVVIKGVSTTGEKIVCKNFQIFHMLTQNLCPPGPFAVSFQLPGPVNNQEAKSYLANGMLEAVVKKM